MNKLNFHRILLLPVCFVLFTAVNTTAQCSISELTVNVSDCDENDIFSAELNFEHTGTGMNGFQVLGNGNNYGTFQYADLPITIGNLDGNCETVYEFLVRDVIDPTCAAFLEYGTVCCDDECALTIIDFSTTECIDNVSFGISLDLEYEFVGDIGFAVYINGDLYGEFNYDDLPISIDDVTTVIEGNNFITVCDIDTPECFATMSFLNPCVCTIQNITSEIVDCSSEDSTYYVIIDFDHVATNDSFQMGYSNGGTNTFLGTFAFNDLPILAGPIFISENEQEILIVDTDNFFCFNSAYLGIVDDCDIECQIFNTFAEAYMCEEGEYFMDIEFDAKDIESSSFEIMVDQVSYGVFEYGENLYTVGPIPSNCETAPTVFIKDLGDNDFCFDFYNFDEPICCIPECNFTFFEVSTVCGPSTITINGTFENNGTKLNGFYFVQFIGTSYGPFPYGDFMFSIEAPLLPDGEYGITINDSQDPNCQISTLFTTQCDEEACMIFDVLAEASECEEGQFYADIEFDYVGSVSDSFVISGNGMTYGTFTYGEQFYTVGPLEGDCETLYEFVISDQILEGCNSFYAFEEPICCGEPCEINDIEVFDYQCINDDSIESFFLNFEHENTSSEMFVLIIDEVDYGSYFYSELPIQYLIDLSTSFVIQIQDSENEECQSTANIELECMDEGCPLNDASIAIVDCSDELENYFVEISVDHTNTGESLEIYLNDTIASLINYSELPFILGPLSLGVAYDIFINDADSGEDCGFGFETLTELCETGLDEAEFAHIEIIQSANTITLENNDAQSVNVQLYNLTGELIDKINLGASRSQSIDLSVLPHGLYLLNISDGLSQKTMKILRY